MVYNLLRNIILLFLFYFLLLYEAGSSGQAGLQGPPSSTAVERRPPPAHAGGRLRRYGGEEHSRRPSGTRHACRTRNHPGPVRSLWQAPLTSSCHRERRCVWTSLPGPLSSLRVPPPPRHARAGSSCLAGSADAHGYGRSRRVAALETVPRPGGAPTMAAVPRAGVPRGMRSSPS